MDDYGRCKTCKHWSPPDVPSWKGWCSIADSEDGEPEYPDRLAYALDGEDHVASLCTSAEFGCVQYKEDNHETT